VKNMPGVTYTSDGDGNRIEKSNGKIYWYGAGEILDDSDTSGNSSDEYVFFGGKRVAMRVVSRGPFFSAKLFLLNGMPNYEGDMQGSARAKRGPPGRRLVEPGDQCRPDRLRLALMRTFCLTGRKWICGAQRVASWHRPNVRTYARATSGTT
jgi:hypothetical protein